MPIANESAAPAATPAAPAQEAPKAPDATTEAPKAQPGAPTPADLAKKALEQAESEGKEQAAPAKDEKKPEKKEEPSEMNKRLAKGFSNLHKKEKTIVEEHRKIAEIKEKMTGQYKELIGIKQTFEQVKANAKRDPIAYLKAADLEYDDVVAFVLNNNSVPEEKRSSLELEEAKRDAKKALDEVAEFKRAQTKAAEVARQRAAERREQAEQEQLRAFRGRAVAYVQGNAVDYPLLNQFPDQAMLVPALMEEALETQNRRMTVKEAAILVEEHLAEQIEKATSQEAWKKRQQAKAPQVPAVEVPAKQEPASKTLTNELAASSKPKPASKKMETDEERMARAVAKYHEVANKS